MGVSRPPRVKRGDRRSERSLSLLGVVKHELKQVGLVTLYFLFCFGVTLVLKKLFLVACATFSPAEGKR